MDLDGGEWTMVWKHSYLEVLPLTTDMYYFSDYFKQCSDLESGEIHIAAYHNKVVRFAYKGWFNWNNDNDWTGGILIEPKLSGQAIGVLVLPTTIGLTDLIFMTTYIMSIYYKQAPISAYLCILL